MVTMHLKVFRSRLREEWFLLCVDFHNACLYKPKGSKELVCMYVILYSAFYVLLVDNGI